MYEHLGWHFPDIDRHFAKSVDQYPITTYQQATIDAALAHVKKFDCAVDVGGNIGLHTVRFSKKFRSVHSFEPTTVNLECLKKNTESLKNVKLYPVGLGDREDKLQIKLPENSNNCGNFSLVDFNDSEHTVVEEPIFIFPLDCFELAPDLIKIDVQGFDYNVLLGAEKTITQHRPVIIIEAETKESEKEIADYLTKLGFWAVDRVKRDKIWISKT